MDENIPLDPNPGSVVQDDSGLRLEVRFGRAEEASPNAVVIFGGMPTNPTWDEYVLQILEGLEAPGRRHLELIRVYILSHGLLGGLASEYANQTSFHFSDGLVIHFSWRAWGDLMQSIVGKREGYMCYYM